MLQEYISLLNDTYVLLYTLSVMENKFNPTFNYWSILSFRMFSQL